MAKSWELEIVYGGRLPIGEPWILEFYPNFTAEFFVIAWLATSPVGRTANQKSCLA